MKTSNALLLSSLLLLSAPGAAADFHHALSGTKPWTHENFLDDPQEFHFAIVPDRTGGERPGFFGQAMKALNLLRPEFVMSIGDLVNWGGAPDAEKQWAEEKRFVDSLDMPFFHVVGNHDIVTGFSGMTPQREKSIRLWKELHGTNTYYSFTYKGCLFLCLDAMETHDYFPPRESMSERQYAWIADEFARHPDARWVFVFMHKPIDWSSDRWLALERKIAARDYTVFCGDLHNFCTARRNGGKKYFMLGTAGGCFDGGRVRDDLRYGVMDALAWVTVTKKGPVVSYLALSGIHSDTVQTTATTLGWIEVPLDQPSHRTEDPALYANEKNRARIPEQRFSAEGYDWNLRHAVILRQGRVYRDGLEKFKPGKKRVLLLGDETASTLAAGYGKDWQVFDMGFAGDRTQNVLWRVVQGELRGFAPDRVVISVGKHNVEPRDDVAAAIKDLAARVRTAAPQAEIVTP